MPESNTAVVDQEAMTQDVDLSQDEALTNDSQSDTVTQGDDLTLLSPATQSVRNEKEQSTGQASNPVKVHPIPKTPVTTFKRKRKANDFSETFVSSAIHRLENISSNASSSSSTQTEFDVFGKSIAAQLNNMEYADAIAMQLKIQQLITEERLRNIRRNANLRSPLSTASSPAAVASYSTAATNVPSTSTDTSNFQSECYTDDSALSYFDL